jgi:CheY-like chemotaxis protein
MRIRRDLYDPRHRLVIVDDSDVVRETLSRAFDSVGFDVVGTVATLEEAERLALGCFADAILIDRSVTRPDVEGGCRRIHEAYPEAALVLISDSSVELPSNPPPWDAMIVKGCPLRQLHDIVETAIGTTHGLGRFARIA